jgi:hypothetical protein
VGIGEWEFDIILLYTILYSPKEISTWYSLKNFSYMRLVVNDIRLLRDEIDKTIIPEKELVFKEFFRIMHRQFLWQQHINYTYTYRFYRIFKHPDLYDLIKKKTNLDLRDMYRTGLLLTGYFINNFNSSNQIKTSLIPQETFHSFLDFFSIDTADFIKKYKDKFIFDDAFLYRFNPLRSYPILIHKENLYCPIPNYIIWKITNGIYYDIVNEKGFDKAFGKSYEDYCGFVLKKIIAKKGIQIIPEISYGKPTKKSSDWILKENNTFLFIECKAKRLRLDSITQFNDNDDLRKDIDKMIGFIFQVYKSVNDAINRRIPNIIITDSSEIHLIILTLDDWHLDLDPFLNNQIKGDLISKFKEAQIPINLIERYPYLVRSIGSFEGDCQLINKFGLHIFYQKLISNTLTDLSDNFTYEDLFTTEINTELLPETK